MRLIDTDCDRCSICGCEVDYEDGGCAIMLTHIYDHTTSLVAVTYCKVCYREFIFKPIRQLNTAGYMNMPLKEEEDAND